LPLKNILAEITVMKTSKVGNLWEKLRKPKFQNDLDRSIVVQFHSYTAQNIPFELLSKVLKKIKEKKHFRGKSSPPHPPSPQKIVTIWGSEISNYHSDAFCPLLWLTKNDKMYRHKTPFFHQVFKQKTGGCFVYETKC
jgi:hypothetical protein